MTNEQKKQLFDLITTMADIFNRKLTQEICEIYVEALSDLPFDKVSMAIKTSVKTYKYFPTVAELRESIAPKEDDRDIANEMAGAILDAIPRFGYNRALDAKQALGPESWFAVERFGGWQCLCDTLIDQLPAVRAQLRDVCRSVMAVKRRDPSRPQMEFQKRNVLELKQSLDEFNKLCLPINNNHD